MGAVAARLVWPALLLASAVAAQPAITDVVNAAGRIPAGLPYHGIARGSLFVIRGTGLGPAEPVRAGFPLPTWDGLGGATVLAVVGDVVTITAMVYASDTEAVAILLSNTPSGDGTIYLFHNGEAAAFPVTIVDAAWGTFTRDSSGAGPAFAFNSTLDGDSLPNTILQPARPGQTVILNGTGAGAVLADETQSGITEAPATVLTVWVGGRAAPVSSVARGTCCAAPDPRSNIPEGTAGWDVLRFIVPEGVAGCHVPVAVEAAGRMSNFATIAIAPEGTPCSDPGGFTGADFRDLPGPLRIGNINLSRTFSKVDIPGFAIGLASDSGSAGFLQFDQPAPDAAGPLQYPALGSCLVTSGKTGGGPAPVSAAAPVVLDAGAAIHLDGNGASRSMQRMPGGTYNGSFGSGAALPFPLPGVIPLFLEPGDYTAANQTGGEHVGAFVAPLTVPRPVAWTNQDRIQTVNRSRGVTVTWTGGLDFVTVHGVSSSGGLLGTFLCVERADAGQFTVPAAVTGSLPPSAVAQSPDGPVHTGGMQVGTSATGKFTAPGLDLGYFSSTVATTKNVKFE